MIYSEFPLDKKKIKQDFGFLSVYCHFLNMDMMAIEIISYSTFIYILYRRGGKVGFIYEDNKLTDDQVTAVYKDVPHYVGDLEQWRRNREGKVEIHRVGRDRRRLD